MSVTHALNAASLEAEPKNVMMQSISVTSTIQAITAVLSDTPNALEMPLTLMSAKAMITKPQIT